jgi:dTDP-4-dehydrorhamnose reductase
MFLIIGGDSEIGAATYRLIQAQGNPVLATTRRRDRIAHDRPFLDLSDPLESWEAPKGTLAACVCAAVARLEACANDPKASARINVIQTLRVIEKLLASGIYVLFLSTNQVFDGRTPSIPCNASHSPISEYGRQKARTEAKLRELMARGAPLAILRLAKVVSPDIPLLRNWIKALKDGRTISAFHDMMLAPVPVDLVCRAITALMNDRAGGIFQLSGPLDATYVEVARIIAHWIGADASLISSTKACSAVSAEGICPLHTTLDSRLLCERYQFEVPDVQEVIKNVIAHNCRLQPQSSVENKA